MKRDELPGIARVPAVGRPRGRRGATPCAGDRINRVGWNRVLCRALPVSFSAGLLVIPILAAAGCAGTKNVSTEIYRGDSIRVCLVEQQDKAGKTVSKGYAHPWNVEAATLKGMLESIRYRGTILLFQQKAQGAFPMPERELLLKPLQEAFSRATADQAVEFAFEHRKRWTIFQRQYRTDGLMFVKDGKLNCAFRNLAFEDVADPESATVAFEGDPTQAPSRTGWTLVPEAGQALVEPDSREFLGPRTFHNWIRLDLAGPWAPRPDPDAADQAAEAAGAGVTRELQGESEGAAFQSEAEIRRQLDFLEELHAEGAVPESYYRKKQQELLERMKAVPAGAN